MQGPPVPLLIRAWQKDKEIVDKVGRDLREVAAEGLGQRRAEFWLKYGGSVALLLYHGLTSGAGLQTLGEEYCGILMVEKGARRTPSRRKLALYVILLVFGEGVVRKLKQFLGERGVLPGWAEGWDLIPFLGQLHLALFFVEGKFYHFVKRILGIHYVLVRKWLASVDSFSARTLRILVFVTVINTALVFGKDVTYLWKKWNSSLKNGERGDKEEIEEKPSTSLSEMDMSKRCTLCLETRKSPAATPCGHIFCWECIIDCLRSKTECPICRESTKPSRVVLLQNYV